jgi:hypothetical protein
MQLFAVPPRVALVLLVVLFGQADTLGRDTNGDQWHTDRALMLAFVLTWPLAPRFLGVPRGLRCLTGTVA